MSDNYGYIIIFSDEIEEFYADRNTGFCVLYGSTYSMLDQILERRLKMGNVKSQTCPICKGRGILKCPAGHGKSGKVLISNFPYQVVTCPSCNGSTKVVCSGCGGTGKVLVDSSGVVLRK